jgi:hypothetical protein
MPFLPIFYLSMFSIAKRLFEQKQKPGVNPNNVIFVGVLSTCCHAGLVDEGLSEFGPMTTFSHHI